MTPPLPPSAPAPSRNGRRFAGHWLPRTLLWRTFLLVAVLMLLSVAAWFTIFRSYEREPRARQLAQTLVSVANLTRVAMVAARPDARRRMLAELSSREGIRIYPAEDDDQIAALPDNPLLAYTLDLVRQQLGPATRMTLERDGEQAIFVSFRIDDREDDEYWVALPRERLERVLPLSWLGWAAAALILSLAGAWLIVFRITRPLKALERAARDIGAGRTPPPLPETGPIEIATVAGAFNQMNSDLARLDQDRALILAGISHDLRTPLTRLRMGIEMGADDSLREGMNADVEEMDKTIGQFLDFARSDGGEPEQPVALADLVTELAAQYQRRGFPVSVTEAAAATLPARPKALRRALANLVDNALRYAGDRQPVEIAARIESRRLHLEVKDRGPGVPAGEVERLKRPFTRLDDARGNAVGAGLGLAIVDRVVRSHQGNFDLLPRPDGGLIARISLPL